MQRFYVIAPNGNKCSAIWDNKEKTMLQTWSGKRKRWESFPVLYCFVDENCVLDMATETNPVINNAGNKIEFKDGVTFARDFRTNKYRKIKNFIL
ncbi:MAG TPA: hypothetical protein DD619_04625 [Alphaproteobacteria bacterium]|nr:hypothetical protein [Alphaproteobacteria bacterium]